MFFIGRLDEDCIGGETKEVKRQPREERREALLSELAPPQLLSRPGAREAILAHLLIR